jgi:hypothetical protein
MAGSSTFYQLRKVVAAADTLTLTAGTTQTITNDITLSGATGQVLSLRSTVNSSQANLSLSALGTQSINYMDVKDNNATGLTLIARNSSVNSGNNTNWVFGGANYEKITG